MEMVAQVGCVADVKKLKRDMGSTQDLRGGSGCGSLQEMGTAVIGNSK